AAAPLAEEALRQRFKDDIREHDEVYWDSSSLSVHARRRTMYGALLLGDVPLKSPDPERVLETLLAAVAGSRLALLSWSKASMQLLARMRFMQRHAGDGWPDLAEEALIASLPDWLG